jgi:hypothetical protein
MAPRPRQNPPAEARAVDGVTIAEGRPNRCSAFIGMPIVVTFASTSRVQYGPYFGGELIKREGLARIVVPCVQCPRRRSRSDRR